MRPLARRVDRPPWWDAPGTALAAARHYFEKDLAALERVRESFKLLGGSA